MLPDLLNPEVAVLLNADVAIEESDAKMRWAESDKSMKWVRAVVRDFSIRE